MTARHRTVLAPNGMVSCAHPIGALVGVRVLERGGTAMDAAVATAAVLGVLNPAMSGLGGDVVCLYFQVLVHHLDGGLPIQAAIDAPRWALDDADALHVEPGLADAVPGLEARGHRVVVGRVYFGACQAVLRDPATGALHGASDPRHGGAALGY